MKTDTLFGKIDWLNYNMDNQANPETLGESVTIVFC